jgi:hypothetical protein
VYKPITKALTLKPPTPLKPWYPPSGWRALIFKTGKAGLAPICLEFRAQVRRTDPQQSARSVGPAKRHKSVSKAQAVGVGKPVSTCQHVPKKQDFGIELKSMVGARRTGQWIICHCSVLCAATRSACSFSLMKVSMAAKFQQKIEFRQSLNAKTSESASNTSFFRNETALRNETASSL